MYVQIIAANNEQGFLLHFPVTTEEELKMLEDQILNKSDYDALV